jgi:hypothetical protein
MRGPSRHHRAGGPSGSTRRGSTIGVFTIGSSSDLGAQGQPTQVVSNAWITEMQRYLNNHILPEQDEVIEWIIHLAKRYKLVEGDLYQRGINDIFMH